MFDLKKFVFKEVQRHMNLLALSLLCRTTRNVEVAGFKLRKGTQIVPQISCVLNDERVRNVNFIAIFRSTFIVFS